MLNKLISDIAIGKQTAKGTAAAAPSYIIPLVGSGAVGGFEQSVTVDEETGQAYAINAHIEDTNIGFSTPTFAYTKAVGLLLLGIFGTDTVTGASAPYSHAFTVSPTSMATPWLTTWGNLESDVIETKDAKVADMEISWDGNKPVQISTTFAALAVLFGASAARPVGGTAMAGTDRFTPASLVFKMSGNSATPVASKITKFSLKMSRGIKAEYFSGSSMPGDLAMGRFSSAPSFTIKPDNLASLYEIATGTSNGTTPTETVVYGSYELTLTCGAATMKIESAKVPFRVKWPDSDASGGAVEVELSADDSMGTASVSPVKVTLVNDVATY